MFETINPYKPFKFKSFFSEYHKRDFTLLDIGCGNHSARITRQYFPRCRYFGLDKGNYRNDNRDFSIMERFFDVDLETGDLSTIPDTTFDVILMAHVIEHIKDGLPILTKLVSKLRPGGKIFVEFPSVRSLKLPKINKGTLNFYDDPTHVRAYTVAEISDTLAAAGMTIIKAQARRDPIRIFGAPITFVLGILIYKGIPSTGLWDILGFADFVYAEKPEDRI